MEVKIIIVICGSSRGYVNEKLKAKNSVLPMATDIDVANDNGGIRPPNYCYICHIIAKKLTNSRAKSTFRAYNWPEHTDGDCVVCDVISSAQEPKTMCEKGIDLCRRVIIKGIPNVILRNAPESWCALQPPPVSHIHPTANNAAFNVFSTFTSWTSLFRLHVVSWPVLCWLH